MSLYLGKWLCWGEQSSVKYEEKYTFLTVLRGDSRIAITEDDVNILKNKPIKKGTELKTELSDDPSVPAAQGRPVVE